MNSDEIPAKFWKSVLTNKNRKTTTILNSACLGSEKGEVLLRGVGTLRYSLTLSETTLLVKCPSVQWQPDGLTIRTEKWLLGAGFLGAPPILLIGHSGDPWSPVPYGCCCGKKLRQTGVRLLLIMIVTACSLAWLLLLLL